MTMNATELEVTEFSSCVEGALIETRRVSLERVIDLETGETWPETWETHWEGAFHPELRCSCCHEQALKVHQAVETILLASSLSDLVEG